MREFKNDKVGNLGFDVTPTQLAHDLAILFLSRSLKLTSEATEEAYYKAYVEAYNKFSSILGDQRRYDSIFKAQNQSE